MSNLSDDDLKIDRLLLDIIRGYSKIVLQDRTIFLRHYSSMDLLQIGEFYRDALNSAIKSGIKNEKSIIDEACRRGIWSVRQEEQIKALEWEIDKMEIAANKISDRFQKSSFQKSIDAKTEDLRAVQDKRKNLCKYSAESLAEGRKLKKLLGICLFYDEALTSPLDVEGEQIAVYRFFSAISEFNDNNNIAKIAYSNAFFDNFTLYYRTPNIIFSRHGFDQTLFQKNILVTASALLNKIKNVSMPDDVMKDPIKILKYKSEDHGSGKKTTVGTDDLKEKMAANGGKLKPEDLLT